MFVIISYMHVLGVGENEKKNNKRVLAGSLVQVALTECSAGVASAEAAECLRRRLLYTLTDCEIRAALANRETKCNVISSTCRV